LEYKLNGNNVVIGFILINLKDYNKRYVFT